MRLLVWLLRAFVFFALFAFALNNQQPATVRWFFGVEWHSPMVIVVLVSFAAGCAFGVLAMVPAWWRHRRDARRAAPGAALAGAAGVAGTAGASAASGAGTSAAASPFAASGPGALPAAATAGGPPTTVLGAEGEPGPTPREAL